MERQDQFFTIQQLSLKLNIPKPTLRFWEKEFDGILVPLRTQGGQRRYALEHVAIIEEINNLKRKGMSLAEIKTKLGNNSKERNDNSNSNGMDLLADRVAEVVRAEVYRFLERQEE